MRNHNTNLVANYFVELWLVLRLTPQALRTCSPLASALMPALSCIPVSSDIQHKRNPLYPYQYNESVYIGLWRPPTASQALK